MHTLETKTTIAEIARRDLRLVVALADLGIGPRYLHWTLADVVRDRGLRLERVLQRLARAVAPPPARAA